MLGREVNIWFSRFFGPKETKKKRINNKEDIKGEGELHKDLVEWRIQ